MVRVNILKWILFFWMYLLIGSFSLVRAGEWYFPIENYEDRIRVKDFGTKIDRTFYDGKESLFPGQRLYGYHAAVDLEYLPGEKDLLVPVYAVGDGEIMFAGGVGGYGGLILQRLDGGLTALYGHINTTAVDLVVGQRVLAGEKLAVLGKEFSEETAGERKHLHFGIYTGGGEYFRGHEDTMEALRMRWLNPSEFLVSRGAIRPGVGVVSENELRDSSTSAGVISQPQKEDGGLLGWWKSLVGWLSEKWQLVLKRR